MKFDWRYAILFLTVGVCIGIVAAFVLTFFSSIQGIAGAFLGLQLRSSAACVNGTLEPLFSPSGAEEKFIGELSAARHSIDVEVYVFTSSTLKNALVEAVQKGVSVRLILEPRVNGNLATASFLKSKGIEVRWASTQFAYTHSKFAVIDGKKVIVGSTNWSSSGLRRNREAAVLVENQELAKSFLAIFEEDWLSGSEVKTTSRNNKSK